jgi:hypothetical protein
MLEVASARRAVPRIVLIVRERRSVVERYGEINDDRRTFSYGDLLLRVFLALLGVR